MIINQLKQNWKSALSVALVSVPLSLSLGIASGASPVAGVLTAIWAGLIAGIIGGSRFNIVGPAGALSGILLLDAIHYGAGILPLIAVASGVIILIAWALQWHKYLIFVPASVIHGFTLGVAFTIGFGQLNFALGLSNLTKHDSLLGNIIESFKNIRAAQWQAVLLTIIGVVIMFGLLKWKPRWPNTVILAVLGILFGYAASTGIIAMNVQTLFTRYGDLSLHLFSIPAFSLGLYKISFLKFIELSAVVAFVVVLETLISAKVADGMTKTKFNQRREVLGVGLANLLSGFFGGLPASGVFARTSINVRTGATSNWSQIINALFVALISLVFLKYFRYIPLSVIAAILIYASIRMVTAEHFRKLYKYDKIAFWNAIVVAGLTLVADATTGIVVGMIVALLVLARRLSQSQANITSSEKGTDINAIDCSEQEIKGGAIVYRFAGDLTYINAKSHIERLQRITAEKGLILNFRNLFYIDADGVEALDEIFENLESRKISVYITGVNDTQIKYFSEHMWYKNLCSEKKVLASTNDALSHALSLKSL